MGNGKQWSECCHGRGKGFLDACTGRTSSGRRSPAGAREARRAQAQEMRKRDSGGIHRQRAGPWGEEVISLGSGHGGGE